MSDSIFNTPQDGVDTQDDNQGDVNYLDQYVGEGKKYATVDELAKAYAHSDRFIDQLKSETTGLRTELNSRLALEELVTKLQNGATNTATSNQNYTNDSDERPHTSETVLSREDIAKLVRDSITEEQTRSQAEANRQMVQAEMKKAWGPNFVENLRNAQRSLGVDEATLDHLAKTSPQLFLNAVLGTSPRNPDPNSSVPPRSQVNTMASDMRSSNSVEREWNELNGLMKTDPQRYWSPSVQNKLMKLMEIRMKG